MPPIFAAGHKHTAAFHSSSGTQVGPRGEELGQSAFSIATYLYWNLRYLVLVNKSGSTTLSPLFPGSPSFLYHVSHFANSWGANNLNSYFFHLVGSSCTSHYSLHSCRTCQHGHHSYWLLGNIESWMETFFLSIVFEDTIVVSIFVAVLFYNIAFVFHTFLAKIIT